MKKLLALAALCLASLYSNGVQAQNTQLGLTVCASNSLSVTGSSANVQLGTCGQQVVITNIGTVEAFYAVGNSSSLAATTSSASLPGGSSILLSVSYAGQYLAAITASSTTTIRITQGEGMTALSGGGGGSAGGTVTIGSALPAGTNVIGKVDTDAGNPTSTLTLTSTTTGYTAGNLIASSATAGSVVVPSFTMTNTTGIISRLRLTSNDTTSTSWGAQTITVDLWSAAPTFTNGDRGAYSPATGTANHLGSFTCVMSAVYGDGLYSECNPAVGNFALLKLSGTSVYWSLTATTGSGTTGASKVFTLTAEVTN